MWIYIFNLMNIRNSNFFDSPNPDATINLFRKLQAGVFELDSHV